MKNLSIIITILFFGQILISCNSTKSVATISRQRLFIGKDGSIEPTLFSAHSDATQRFAIIVANKDGKFTTFAENPPDAAIQSAVALLGKADVDGKTAGKVSAEAKLDFAKTIIELGKRSESINFQRDGMFRLSEMYNNGALSGSQLIGLIDSLQSKAIKLAAISANNDKETIQLEKLKELNKLFLKTDSTARKPTAEEIISILNNL